ncbi:MAG: hypothetical protein OER97_07480 [Gammaproteobacteria bacterium]|nr:hypothetical protein [Gammaproteobacteria bacterium]
MRIYNTAMAFFVSLVIVACGDAAVEKSAAIEEVDVSNDAPIVTFTPKSDTMSSGKPSGPITVAYRIIGKPVVGQPVAIDLRVSSTLGPQPINIGYRINDATAMQLAKSQPETVSLAPNSDDQMGVQQVRIVPMREGRLYLNVSASVETENGSMSTVTAIPIQVGDAARPLSKNGELQIDAEGNQIRVLPAKED